MAGDGKHPFNPCSLDKDEQIPAKIWELLRRNPSFRAVVQRLVQLDTQERESNEKTGDYHGPAWHESWELIESVAESHPFAAVALQWLVPEPLFHFRRVALPLGTEWRKRPAFIPRLIKTGKGTTPNIKDKKHWRWWKNASEGNHAGHSIRRGPDVHWTTSRFPRLSDKVNPIEEWSRFKWPFTLEHSWPDAPPGFRRQFLFIWRDRFDSRPKNPISKDRSDSPFPHETDFFSRLAAWRVSIHRHLKPLSGGPRQNHQI